MARVLDKVIEYSKHIACGILLIISLAQLQACSSTKKLLLRYEASPKLNPDINLRPSPLVVNSYQLKSQAPFQDLEFFTLYEKAQLVLGDSLLYQDQIEIRPNQVIESEQDYCEGAKFLAIVAAYRDIDNAVWQKIILLDPKEKKPIQILLGPKEVVVGEGNS